MLLLGDFSIYADTNNTESCELKSLLECFNFVQHVDLSTHSKGDILDLVCTSNFQNVCVFGHQSGLSDHNSIEQNSQLPFPHPRSRMK